MGIFSKTWNWKYEIAPMYMEVKAQPLTAAEQTFYVLCGITSEEVFKGSRLPQVGELVSLPGFAGEHKVANLRTTGLTEQVRFSNRFPAIAYIDSKDFGDTEYWRLGLDRMRPMSKWVWSTNHDAHNYLSFGYGASDWKNRELKFAERDYVLHWVKSGERFLAPDGKSFLSLEPKHRYLYDWFPEVEEHIEGLRWK
jgi:hypothetical protein